MTKIKLLAALVASLSAHLTSLGCLMFTCRYPLHVSRQSTLYTFTQSPDHSVPCRQAARRHRKDNTSKQS